MEDGIVRAYAQLGAMKEHFAGDQQFLTERDVIDYHAALDQLEALGFDLTEFRIPANEVRPHRTSTNLRTGVSRYTSGKFVSSTLLRRKLDAVLTYFQLTLTSQPAPETPRIGFVGPRKD